MRSGTENRYREKGDGLRTLQLLRLVAREPRFGLCAEPSSGAGGEMVQVQVGTGTAAGTAGPDTQVCTVRVQLLGFSNPRFGDHSCGQLQHCLPALGIRAFKVCVEVCINHPSQWF